MIRFLKQILIFVILLVFPDYVVFALTADSLKTIIASMPDDTSKIRYLTKLSLSLQKDKKFNETNLCLNELFRLSDKLSDNFGLAAGYYVLGNLYLTKQNTDSALYNFSMAYGICEKYKFVTEYPNILYCIGYVYETDQKYPEAFSYYQKALYASEGIKDYENWAFTCIQIAYLHTLLKNYNTAADYFKQGLAVATKNNNKQLMADFLNNIGLCLENLNKRREAQLYYERALNLRLELKDSLGIAQVYNNMGIICFLEKDFKKSLDYLEKSQFIKEKLKKIKDLSTTYMNIGELYKEIGNFEKSIEFYEKAIHVATLSKENVALIDIYKGIAQSYLRFSKTEKAFDYFMKYITLKESVFTFESNKQISEMQTKYETEKKEKEIQILEKEKKIKKKEIKKQTIFRNSFILGFILMLLIAFIIYRSYRSKRTANVLLREQKLEIEEKNEELLQQKESIVAQRDELIDLNEELNQQNEEIKAQRDELETQKNNAEEQKFLIEEQKAEILSSIRYAKRIQEAALPEKAFMENILPEHFIFFKPKDIVSGDFYWVTKQEGRVFVAVADCAEHGVPGALMSLIGITLLNEIIGVKKIYEPSEILVALHQQLCDYLKQYHENKDLKIQKQNHLLSDQINIALCSFDFVRHSLSFSGANRDVLITHDSMIQHIKGDAHSIGDQIKRNITFTNHEISFEKNYVVYLFTDGFLKQKNSELNVIDLELFKDMLLQANSLSCTKQYENLLSVFTEWKGFREQDDDVLILGIKAM